MKYFWTLIIRKMTLTRIDSDEKVLGGVCLGISQYYNLDLTLVRAGAFLLFFTPIPIVIIYFVWMLILPKSNVYLENNFNSNYTMSNQNKNGNMVGGLILIALGAIFSFKTFFDINLFGYIRNMWPLVLIGVGIWLIVKHNDDNNHPSLPNTKSEDKITY